MKSCRLAAVLLAVALVLLPRALMAQLTESNQCCNLTLSAVGARALSLGNALAARGIPDGVWVNPASLAAQTIGELRVHTERTDVMKRTAITGAFGLGRAGTGAVSLRIFDQGEVTNTDDNNNEYGKSLLADYMVTVGYATEALPAVRAGIQYSLYLQRDTAVSTTSMVDVGLQSDASWLGGLQLGVALLHVGPNLQVNNAEQSDPTPKRIRLGAAYEVLHHFVQDTTLQLIASADLNMLSSANDPRTGMGLELILDRSLFLRAGYAAGTGLGTGAALGVGILYQRFDIGVAKSFLAAEDFSNVFQVTVAVRF